MTKVMKKLGAVLMSFALVLTMMPFLAMPADAATDVFTVTLNDETVGTITDEWMQDEANNYGPQIFPNHTKNGFKYVIAEGPALSSIFDETIGISDIGELPNALIEYKADAAEAAKNPISGRDLADAVAVTKAVDSNGADVDFNSADKVFVAKADGSEPVVPVLAFRESKAFTTYGDAKEALNDGSWETDATNNIQPYVGGNLVKEADLMVKDGSPKMDSVNFTGKFVLTGKNILNIKLDAPTEPEKGSFTLKVGETLKITPKYTSTEASVIYGGGYCTWESDPNYLTDDPQAEGVFKAVAPGKTKVLFKVEKDVGQDTIEVATLGEWDITISAPVAPAKPKPAKPASLKATNIKKKTAKLKWGKAANAEGYEVYRSLKKTKGFKKVATVTNTTYKNKKLKKGKTYYFKIKSYNVVNGKKVYSAFSKVVKVKIKK